ncbi:hypothetical protein [Catenuloplanes japonicus]|uniref:hypothetical protein n=1 Tax=Catenuloplanes japonicus TaxID=33876 RepID=UPI0012F773DD|nr:hypothetical protein [Catenuloplanes japonicus]
MRRLLTIRRSLHQGQVSREWIVASVCTTLETACNDFLDDLLRARENQTDSPLERAMIRDQRSEMKASWHSRLQWLARGFSKTLSSDVSSKLSALIELRNAIAHNGDTFTPRQTQKYVDFLNLRQMLESELDVRVNGTSFRLGEHTGNHAIGIGRQVVNQLL